MIVFAREPIFARNGHVFAYQLNINREYEQSFISNWAKEQLENRHGPVIPWSDLLDGFSSVLRLSNDLLMQPLTDELTPEDTLFEINDLEQPTGILERLNGLKKLGFRFVAGAQLDLTREAMQLIDFAKLSTRKYTVSELIEIQQRLAQAKIKAIAINVDSQESYQAASNEGFDYYQGFYFLDRATDSKDELPASKLAVLRLLSEINNQSLDIRKLEKIFEVDATLSYLLFRYINNPLINKYEEITSIRHALSYLGEVMIRKFIAIVSLTQMNADNAPELLQVSLVRAKFCELMSAHIATDKEPVTAFMTGLFSLIDIILGRDMHYLMDNISLSKEIKQALTEQKGRLHHMLQICRGIESAHWSTLFSALEGLEIDKELANRLYIQSVKWANECGIPESKDYPIKKA